MQAVDFNRLVAPAAAHSRWGIVVLIATDNYLLISIDICLVS
jgi:hypothetical protein